MMVALHLYSIAWVRSRESNVSVFKNMPVLGSTVSPTLIPSPVMMRLPAESSQVRDGVFCRWSDLFAVHVRMNLFPSSREEVEVITTESALSGSTIYKKVNLN